MLDYNPLIWLSGGVGVSHSGGKVSSWDDQSGNGNHFIQNTGSLQPHYAASAINGKPGVDFRQAHEMRSTLLSSTLSECTMMLVGIENSKYLNGQTLIASTSNLHNKRIYTSPVIPNRIYYRDGGTTSDVTFDSANGTLIPFVITLHHQASNVVKMRVDKEPWSALQNAVSVTSNTSPLVIGNWGSTGNPRFWDGIMCEVVILPYAASDAVMDKIADYLINTYAI